MPGYYIILFTLVITKLLTYIVDFQMVTFFCHVLNSSTQNKLCGIATTSADNAWAVGNGEILYTINGGITWEQQPSVSRK